MRPTGLGIAALTLSWLALGAAFAFGAWGAGLAAFGVLATIASTRSRLAAMPGTVTRSVQGQAVQGSVVQSIVDVTTATRVVDVVAPVPVGMRLIREHRTHSAGRVRLQQDLQILGIGQPDWPLVQVHTCDAWGLWSERADVPAPASFPVRADPRWALLGRRLGLANPVQATIRAPAASERGLEVERLRDYLPGDRMRDIDWKATSRLEDLQVRERERHAPQPVTVLLDCSPCMRVQRQDSKLVSAVRVARGALALGSGAGTTGHLVHVLDAECQATGVTGTASAEAALLGLLSSSPPLAPVDSQPTQVSPEQVLAAMPKSAGLQILLLDGEVQPDFVCPLLPLLKSRGPAILILPASGAHLYLRSEARGAVLAQLRRWRANRRRVQATASALQIPCWILKPGDEERLLGDLARRLP